METVPTKNQKELGSKLRRWEELERRAHLIRMRLNADFKYRGPAEFKPKEVKDLEDELGKVEAEMQGIDDLIK